MNTETTTYHTFEASSDERRRLLRQEEFILDVTEKILEALEGDGITQAELARRLGKSRSHVSQLLNGSRNLTLRTLADLSDALGRRVQVQMHARGKRARQVRDVVDLSAWKKRKIGRTVNPPQEDVSLPAVQGMCP